MASSRSSNLLFDRRPSNPTAFTSVCSKVRPEKEEAMAVVARAWEMTTGRKGPVCRFLSPSSPAPVHRLNSAPPRSVYRFGRRPVDGPPSGSGLSESLVAGFSGIFKVSLECFCAGNLGASLKVTKVVLKWLVSPTSPFLLGHENTR